MTELWSFGHEISPHCSCFLFLSLLEYVRMIWGFHGSCVGDSGVVECDIALLGISWNFEGTWCLRNVGEHPPTQNSTSEDLIPVDCACLHHRYNILPAVLYWLKYLFQTYQCGHTWSLRGSVGILLHVL